MNKEERNYLKTSMLCIAIALLSSCAPKDVHTSSFGGDITIAPDDKHIAFNLYKNGVGSIYTANIDGTDIKPLTVSSTEYRRNPEYSPDGSKILFLSILKNIEKPCSYLSVVDVDGLNMRRLTSNDSHITEAIFSPDGKKIYFIKSSFFGNYAPMVQAHSHDFDIYAIDIDGSNEKRLTNFDEYDMDGLSITSDGKTLLFSKTVTYDKSKPIEDNAVRTLHFLSLSETKEITRLDPKGNFNSLIYNSRLAPNDKAIIFSALSNKLKSSGYELFLLNLENKKVTQLTSLYSLASGARFFHNQNKILFSHYMNWPKKPAQFQLMEIGIDGKDLRKINLEIQ